MSQFFIDFINQLNTSRATQQQLADVMRIQLGNKSSAREKAAAAEKSPRWEYLNDVGRKAAKREELSSMLQSNAQARVALKKLRAEMKSAIPKVPGRKKDDLVGFLEDQERRAYVRSLPQEQRDRAYQLHPDIAGAVVRAPPEMSGISPTVHGELVNEMLRRTHGAELANIAADISALEIADELIWQADKEIRAAAEVAHASDFRTWAKPLVDPILAEAGADFEDLYRRREPEGFDIFGTLTAA